MAADPAAAAAWPDHPVILEVNTWVWLDALGRRLGAPVTLKTVPAHVWDDLAGPGIDAVWLMGVWERSPLGAEIARRDPGVRASLEAALADMTDDDVVGSPYSVHRYAVDARLGGDDGLAAARAALAARGARLLVDYVPNHVARDHPWTTQHPEYFVRAAVEDDDGFVDIGGTRIALARDPHFPPWTDVAQLNAFSPALRGQTVRTLEQIATMADGVRCDMAMLLVNEVFARTWGEHVGAPPSVEFWPPVIEAVRRRSPHFLFVAEAYWDYERVLIEHGFDHCYDKRFYDRLVEGDAPGLREHLHADPGWQRHLVRFAENHDEPRAAATMPADALAAALVAVTTVPGASLLYEGQLEGRSVRPPVQLGRRPDEPADERLATFGRHLLELLDRSRMRDGAWMPCDVAGWPDNPTADALLAWTWQSGTGRTLVVVNLSAHAAQGRVTLPWRAHGEVVLADVLDGRTFVRDGGALAVEGLHVELGPWGVHVLTG